MSDLVEFLLARIAEDQLRVDSIPDWHSTDSARGPGWGSRGSYCPLCDHYMFDGTEVVTEEAWWDHMENVHRRTRVLAECEAKRRIIAEVREADLASDAPDNIEISSILARDLLRLLALPYADHPDYRDEWRPTAWADA